jgi:hypothetical protein
LKAFLKYSDKSICNFTRLEQIVSSLMTKMRRRRKSREDLE